MTEQNQQQQQQQQTPGGGAGGEQNQQQQQQQAGVFNWQTDLPENMRGATLEETMAKVGPAFKGYQTEWSKREPALTKVEDLVLEITHDKAKPFFDPKSPMAKAFAEAAVEMKLPKSQAQGLANKVMGILADGGALADVFDAKANVTAIAKVLGHSEMNDAAKTALQQFETESLAWADNTAKQLKLSEQGQAELESLVLTPGGVELIKALRAQGGNGFALGGQGGAQVLTKEAVFAKLNDDRYNSTSPKFDPAFRKEADADYERLKAASR